MKKTGEIQILLILMVLIHKPIFAQIVAMDTMYRTSDTIYFKLTEKIKVDTSYNIFPIEKNQKSPLTITQSRPSKTTII